jgi:hypothetical protein
MGSVGLHQVTETGLAVRVAHSSFDEWWDPYLLGVSPAGRFVAGLSPDGRAELRDRCRTLLPDQPFDVTARAWAARGIA